MVQAFYANSQHTANYISNSERGLEGEVLCISKSWKPIPHPTWFHQLNRFSHHGRSWLAVRFVMSYASNFAA